MENTKYMTLKEFCELTKISTSTAYRLIRNGTLPATKLSEPGTGKFHTAHFRTMFPEALSLNFKFCLYAIGRHTIEQANYPYSL